ncbi:MAG: hypothetical protein RIC15_02560 [Vicingaceae bacterium]
MSAFNLKRKLGEFYLRRKLKNHQRNRELKNLGQCNSILLLSCESNDMEARQMNEFLAVLKSDGKEVFSLFLPDFKRKEEKTYSANIEVINKDHLNYIGIPSSSYIDELVNREFDLLIDLSISDHFPLKYIHAMSQVKFRVGPAFNYKRDYADLTIELTDIQGVEYLISQIKFYLTNINQHVTQS